MSILAAMAPSRLARGLSQSSINQLSRRTISSAKLTVSRTQDESKFENRPRKEDLIFGTTLSDHMLTIEWEKEGGWKAPNIIPYQDLKISPAASGLHYGLQCFEGMKAYRSLDHDDSIRLFRPDLNMKRLAASMERLQMPGHDFDPQELIECIASLVREDERWIPSGEGYSLYLRPTVVATHAHIGMTAPESFLLYVITSPVGPYYKTGFKPVRLMADSSYVRAWPGGTGNNKVGGNYAPTMKPAAKADEKGYSQVLWLFGENHEVTEVGSMNVFFVIRDKETNRPKLVTAPLTRGDVLPGVTRNSILHLTRAREDYDVSERFPTMGEIAEAAEEGRLLEAFGAGTSAVVAPIECIHYQGKDISIPATGELTQSVWEQLIGIQYGRVEGPPGWSVKIT